MAKAMPQLVKCVFHQPEDLSFEDLSLDLHNLHKRSVMVACVCDPSSCRLGAQDGRTPASSQQAT